MMPAGSKLATRRRLLLLLLVACLSAYGLLEDLHIAEASPVASGLNDGRQAQSGSSVVVQPQGADLIDENEAEQAADQEQLTLEGNELVKKAATNTKAKGGAKLGKKFFKINKSANLHRFKI